MEIKKVFVMGAGTMGSAIAEIISKFNLEVLLGDLTDDIAQKAMRNIEHHLQRKVEKGKMKSEEKDTLLSRIKIAHNITEASQADFVIEAIIEDIKSKKKVFATLDKLCPPEIILATNTSTLSITDIATVTRNPERVVGIHFFNPVSRMELVEIARGKKTSQETVVTTKKFAERLGKTPVDVNDTPGFIVNRLLIPMINEAIFALSEGVANKESIDLAMKLGAAHPMGPLVLADLIGLDVCLYIMETLEKNFGDPKYRPCPLLQKMVEERKLGRKTGEGFYSYRK